MEQFRQAGVGRFCWLDLAAADAARAKGFYARLFGWSAREQEANGGRFTRLSLGADDVGSLYQLSAEQIARGAGSHWTAYVRVADVDETARRAEALGGEVLVSPFDVAGAARIALIRDGVGAPLGLWAPL